MLELIFKSAISLRMVPTWEFVRDAYSRGPLQTQDQTLGVGTAICFNKPSSLGTIALNQEPANHGHRPNSAFCFYSAHKLKMDFTQEHLPSI